MKTAVIVGNPKPKSRTLDAGILVARKLTGRDPDMVVDIIDLGSGLLGWGDIGVTDSVQAIQSMDILIVASPTFKATYTGLLKLYLDQFPTDGLLGVTAFPLMLGAGPAHAMAPDLLLKPVLVELGASCPSSGLYLIDKSFAEDPRLDAWVSRSHPYLPHALAA
jgi:FMN reductase